jgi:fructose 1,6-bisphosphatase
MAEKLTVSVIKADVGGYVGGTQASIRIYT